MYVQRNTEGRSCNYCCSGKAVSIIHTECVSVAFVLSKQSVCAVFHFHLWPLHRYNIFLHYLINGPIFGKSYWL